MTSMRTYSVEKVSCGRNDPMFNSMCLATSLRTRPVNGDRLSFAASGSLDATCTHSCTIVQGACSQQFWPGQSMHVAVAYERQYRAVTADADADTNCPIPLIFPYSPIPARESSRSARAAFEQSVSLLRRRSFSSNSRGSIQEKASLLLFSLFPYRYIDFLCFSAGENISPCSAYQVAGRGYEEVL